MDLLEKSSILLTPTAYNNGEALCVKPSDGSGDFDFSRNSAATRVNAQGLVENVQILSSNLVQNGSFSEEGSEEVSNGSFSQEGSELITNGDFSNGSTGWALGQGWSVSNDKANSDGNNNYSQLRQTNILTIGKSYKITFDLNYVSGLVKFTTPSTNLEYNLSGTYTAYFVADAVNVVFTAWGDFTGSIDNVSCVEVAQNWDLGTGWSIGENKANGDGSGTAYSIALQSLPISAISGNTVKLEYTISNYVSGSVRPTLGVVNGLERNSNGTFIEYIKLGSNAPSLQLVNRANALVGSITNISVKEVGQNWVLDSANIEVGKLTLNSVGGAMTYAYQIGLTLVANTSYLISLNATRISGDTNLAFGSTGVNNVADSPIISTSGIQSYNFTPTTNVSNFGLKRNAGGSGAVWEVTNISVIEITDDTNLPRINYEGFSYQDALGSEEIVNGNDTSNIVGLADNQNITIQTSFLTIGKTYKIDFEIYDYVEGSIFLLRPNDLGVGSAVSANGTYTYTVVADASTSLIFRTDGLSTTLKLKNVSVKEYLGQEVVPDSGCGSWLFEPQSTNLVTYSEDFSTWSKVNSTYTANQGIAPDGSTTMDLITYSSVGGSLYKTMPTIIGTTYTLSLYMATQSGTIDINIGNINAGVYETKTVTTIPTRFSITQVASANNRLAAIESLGIYSVLVWGIQLEAQSYATSYIPTNGEANGVTRNQDVCTNGGSLASINSTEGTLYAEMSGIGTQAALQTIGMFSNNVASRVLFRRIAETNRVQALVYVNLIIQFNVSAFLLDGFNKVALKYKENDFALWLNGVEVGSSNSGLVPVASLSKLSFKDEALGNPFFGKTKALAVWKEALSDAELTELTTI